MTDNNMPVLRSIAQTLAAPLGGSNSGRRHRPLRPQRCGSDGDRASKHRESLAAAPATRSSQTDWSPPSKLKDRPINHPAALILSVSARKEQDITSAELFAGSALPLEHETPSYPISAPHQPSADHVAIGSSLYSPDHHAHCTASQLQQSRTTPTAARLQNTREALYLVQPLSALLPPALRLHSNDIKPAMQRKIWVKRPAASATRVEVQEDDLVDNVRDVILHKYANSLGRSIDSPDITLKIVSREQANKNIASERILSPEESIGRTLDAYYPGGQTIEEALIIEVPQRRTPKPSPRPGNHLAAYYAPEDFRPGEAARDYFPPMPLHSPRLAHVQHATLPNGSLPVHSMSVLTTGQVPPLPSPGGGHTARRYPRPKYGRQHTSSPTILHTTQPNGHETKTQLNGAPTPAPALPTPPAQPDHNSNATPPNRTTSPHPNRMKKKKPAPGTRDPNSDPVLPSKPASAALLDGRVPPINVLIVEDNVINLRLLEQFMRRLKVRWKTAMNGKEAVSVWREGGFHLVLMDIQLPVMNGLEATKEIRRLESVNGIGISVFGETETGNQFNETKPSMADVSGEDKLEDSSLFKSPVIIVALTASSLQSDRHEALAVGCNDFLTKPVNFGWMERKVTEWGCMQALIDFDGWRKWKEIEAKKASVDPEQRKKEEKEEKAKARAALKAAMSRPPPSAASANKQTTSPEAKRDENERSGSASSSIVTSPTAIEYGQQSIAKTGANSHTNSSSGKRNFRGSRSGGSISSSLPATAEVDEKS